MINANFEKYLRTAASKNLFGAAISIFRTCFRRSSLSMFHKIGVLKTFAKFLWKHICWSLFSVKLQDFSLKISMWAYNLMVNNIVRSKYIFVENDKTGFYMITTSVMKELNITLQSQTFFNPIFILFLRIHVFQGPVFFRVWVHVFQGPGSGFRSCLLSGSGYRF